MDTTARGVESWWRLAAAIALALLSAGCARDDLLPWDDADWRPRPSDADVDRADALS